MLTFLSFVSVDFDQILHIFPHREKHSYGPANQRINSLEIESKYDYGIELMENALRENPDSLRPYYTLGLLLHKKGELEKAIEAMRKVADKYPAVKAYADTLAKMEKELEETK